MIVVSFLLENSFNKICPLWGIYMETSVIKITTKFLEETIFNYQQSCKRAINILDSLSVVKYPISKKGLFIDKNFLVNAYAKIEEEYGDDDRMLEKLLEKDLLSCEDYQTVKFYEVTEGIEKEFVKWIDRIEDGTLTVDSEELELMFHLHNFKEDLNLSKEELLSAFKL